MNHIRPAAVAGLFYPGEAAPLRRMIDQLLEANPAVAPAPRALIVPHAGFVYSGGVAARGYNVLRHALREGHQWRRVMLLGPNHRVPLRGIAAPDAELFTTPGGSMAIDSVGLAELQRRFGVQVRPDVHAMEHCLEVQLPFLLTLAPSLRLLPLVVGQEQPERVAALIEWAWAQGDILVIVSSDLSHYHPYAEAKQIDGRTDQLIRGCSATLRPEQACGAHALNGLLLAAEHQGLSVERLEMKNSGDTAGGRDQVVGYASYAVH
jgi:AmmeMemoRadiSam system protein B